MSSVTTTYSKKVSRAKGKKLLMRGGNGVNQDERRTRKGITTRVYLMKRLCAQNRGLPREVIHFRNQLAKKKGGACPEVWVHVEGERERGTFQHIFRDRKKAAW